MKFEPMYGGALVTCSELVWQLGRSQPRLFLDFPASRDGRSAEHLIGNEEAFMGDHLGKRSHAPPAMEQVEKKFRLTDEQWKRIGEHFSGGAHC
jgi:hypothetical protein